MIEVSIHYPICKIVNESSQNQIKINNETAQDKIRFEIVFPKRPFLFWTYVSELEVFPCPKGYGVAYYDYNRNRFLFAPMPANVFIAASIKMYYLLKYGFAKKMFEKSASLCTPDKKFFKAIEYLKQNEENK